jgi:hypothetical protein
MHGNGWNRKRPILILAIVLGVVAVGGGTTVKKQSLRDQNWQYHKNKEYGFSFHYPAGWSVNSREQQIIVWSDKNFKEEFLPLDDIGSLPNEERPKNYGAVQITLVSGLRESLTDYARYVSQYAKLHPGATDQQSRWYFLPSDFGNLRLDKTIQGGSLFISLDSPSRLVDASSRTKPVSTMKSDTLNVAVVTAYRDPKSARNIEEQIKQIIESLRVH